jgi:formylglycine-generating enzyme required for sulfatase activity
VNVGDYFISRYEVTSAEYCEFLNDPAVRAEIGAGTNAAGMLLLPAEVRGNRRKLKCVVARDGSIQPPDNQEAFWGVRYVSRLAAERYVRWRNEREAAAGGGWTYALPSADEIEKAARGADERHFPWGDSFDWCLTCSHRATESQASRRYRFPTDASPYDVRDLAGSLAEITRTDELPPGDDAKVTLPESYDCRVKGGSGFDDLEPFYHLAGHTRERKNEASYRLGFRLVAYPCARGGKSGGGGVAADSRAGRAKQ